MCCLYFRTGLVVEPCFRHRVPIASERCPTDEAGPGLIQHRAVAPTPSVEVHMAPIEQNEPVVEEAPLVEETLVEEVSIDGMCGVY